MVCTRTFAVGRVVALPLEGSGFGPQPVKRNIAKRIMSSFISSGRRLRIELRKGQRLAQCSDGDVLVRLSLGTAYAGGDQRGLRVNQLGRKRQPLLEAIPGQA